ncbi:caspase, EACC1-associated type [Nonomuraea angiospora]|uniref:caspase, EACC1-associated type n=1 Tax=Nonomuraea angiospora TaxID=46172 RepID=UPI0029B79D41|nr:P-loop NTPase fold protein [Nonomuraea angiospora]MDX3101857.1 P-loop NTPase fold protein [Nonomuraea angiospora]
MARLPDPLRSEAVLVGCGDYHSDELASIPAIGNNLRDLSQVLHELGGFANPQVLLDPDQARDVTSTLREAVDRAEDVLLVYYAGHGLVDESGELHLGLMSTEPRDMTVSALPYAVLRRILTESRARTRVLILDCCFSGRATGFLSSAVPDLAAMSEVSGTFVLSSASRNGLALARPDEPYTAFTGELIRLLSQGIPGPEPVLTLYAIASALRSTLSTLGYPTPQVNTRDTAGDLGLVRNQAYDPSARSVPEQVAPPGEQLPELETQPAEEQADAEPATGAEEDLEWSTDAPATVDLLHRAPIATVIALRLVETHVTQPGTSFLLHVDGPWGSGKSSLLNLVEERVAPYFQVVRFDAWQQSRLAPAWWSLLTALRSEITRSRPQWRRPFIRIRESVTRIRRTGAPYALAFVLVAIVAVLLGYLLWPRQPAPLDWQQLAKTVTALFAALGTLGAGAILAARLFLWDSARGARLFEQTQSNPMADISAHFRWLLNRSEKPIAFFIDDLDRCDQKYVVELLDTIQTMVRDMGGAQQRPPAERAAYFVVAADGAWLRRSYETAHDSFVDCMTEPGRPLGYLFLDKLFQLTLSMPALAGAAQSSYLDRILRIEERAASSADEGPRRRRRVPQTDGGLQERLRQFEEGRAQSAVAALSVATAERRRTEHTLRKFAPVLGDNPRAVKKFLNTYSVLRSIRFLEDVHVDPDALALWSLITVRWPNIAHHLAACPEAVAGIRDPLWCPDHFPEPLRSAATSADLRAVVTSPDGGPLTPDLIRQCCGASAAPC